LYAPAGSAAKLNFVKYEFQASHLVARRPISLIFMLQFYSGYVYSCVVKEDK